MQVSYGTLRRWIEGHREISSIVVYGQEDVKDLKALLAPQTVQGVPILLDQLTSRPLDVFQQGFSSLVGRFDTIIVLCAADGEVTTGQTVYRILAEAFLSHHIVLIGPSLTQVWPGGRHIASLRRVRELAILLVTGGMGLAMTVIVLMTVALQGALIRLRLLR